MDANCSTTEWTVLDRCEWTTLTDLVTALADALGELRGVADDAVLYDYVDADAVDAVFGAAETRGAHELRFDCEGHEVRVEREGVIAARSYTER
jgi:hypothetical protein